MATFLLDPSPEEMAAIIAAVEIVWPRPRLVDPSADDDNARRPAWRFSGRWWNTPIAPPPLRPGCRGSPTPPPTTPTTTWLLRRAGAAVRVDLACLGRDGRPRRAA